MRRFFLPSVRDVIVSAKTETLASGNTRIEIPHLLIALSLASDDPCAELMQRHGFDAEMVRSKMHMAPPIEPDATAVLSAQVEDVLKSSAYSAFLHRDRRIHPFNVLLTLLEQVKGPPWLIDHLVRIGLDHHTALNALHQDSEALRVKYRPWLDQGMTGRTIRSTGLRRILAWT